ncbi:hypothetical protein cyc_01585 [Cyclospora cayetanensis]|uniref:Uncharacterized protein n=1 Tax=Cyclospora cayetanensis TaxID=88456 RepID=A0A1D3D343_9EIME|nr:hypothetical protein cyc_01585 [Cyclospora cayetanensis]
MIPMAWLFGEGGSPPIYGIARLSILSVFRLPVSAKVLQPSRLLWKLWEDTAWLPGSGRLTAGGLQRIHNWTIPSEAHLLWRRAIQKALS